MSSPVLDSGELDFEDVIAHFERNLKSSPEATIQLETNLPEGRKDNEHNLIMDMTDLEPDLQALCGVLMEHVQSSCRPSMKSGLHGKQGVDYADLDGGVTKEVFRAEIKTTLSQMQNLRESQLEGSATLSGSQRSTLNSLKRQVRERDEQLVTIKRKLKQAQIVKYRLEDSVTGYRVANDEYEDANEFLENEVKELQEQNAALTKRCSDADVKQRRDQRERERLQATLAKFRQEIVVAHQDAVNARTDTKQAKKRIEHLEARAAESKASSAAVSMRITELREIQDEMIATMRGAENSGDATAARRTLVNLGEQRSRLVGKIANLLTRNRKPDENTQRDANKTQGSNASESSRERAFETPNHSSVPGNGSNLRPAEENRLDSDVDRLNKKQRFESIRKFGNELTRMTTGRPGRRAMMANVEKTCEAVERDTEALREVIELKDNELERMEDVLAEANDRAAALETALQRERQKKRLENRNMRDPAMEKAKTEMRSFTTARRKKSTLFDWQKHSVKTEDTKDEAIEATISARVTVVDDESWTV